MKNIDVPPPSIFSIRYSLFPLPSSVRSIFGLTNVCNERRKKDSLSNSTAKPLGRIRRFSTLRRSGHMMCGISVPGLRSITMAGMVISAPPGVTTSAAPYGAMVSGKCHRSAWLTIHDLIGKIIATHRAEARAMQCS